MLEEGLGWINHVWVVSHQCDATLKNEVYNYDMKIDEKLIILVNKTLVRINLKY